MCVFYILPVKLRIKTPYFKGQPDNPGFSMTKMALDIQRQAEKTEEAYRRTLLLLPCPITPWS